MNEPYPMSPREAYAAYMLGGVFLDVRENEVYLKNTPDIKRMVRVPFSELETRYSELPVNQPILIFSGVGVKSNDAARFLRSRGYDNVHTIDGGVIAWQEEGLPVRH
jgi:rhodanese-related sulfurtransferase